MLKLEKDFLVEGNLLHLFLPKEIKRRNIIAPFQPLVSGVKFGATSMVVCSFHWLWPSARVLWSSKVVKIL